MNTVIKNARITGTMLGVEDHGIMTAWLYLDYGGSGQGFGGYCLDGPFDDEKKMRLPSRALGNFVARVLRVVGVESWEKLPGQVVRVRCEDNGVGRAVSLGNCLRDEWFTPDRCDGGEMKQKGIVTFAVVFAIFAASFIATHSAVLLGEAIRSAEAKDCRQ